MRGVYSLQSVIALVESKTVKCYEVEAAIKITVWCSQRSSFPLTQSKSNTITI